MIGSGGKILNMSKIQTSITLDPDIYEWLKQKAEDDNRSMGAMVNLLLKKQKAMNGHADARTVTDASPTYDVSKGRAFVEAPKGKGKKAKTVGE
jgi:hypothetical protein